MSEQEKVEQEEISAELETQNEQEKPMEETEIQDGDALENAIARVQELEEQLIQAVKKEQDILLRTRAEIDNIRRRAEQDVEKAHKFALEKFAKDLLETIDNLERALSTPANVENETIKSLVDGVELTLKGLLSTVARFGVEPVGVIGETFNLNYTKLFPCNQQKGLKVIKLQ